ncbi:protein kinase, putative [Trichomonas vaginalis G3]|uniref:Protein kinase, putative n=1 Tax=Trichomonas vaginalis (strain ATCC PRA-98 / G3) TaxID=412133 RepID=A2F519_TRIV3|nr:protein serine/threonine kinase protein [Trichomonas vaginalis G3]EAY00023.1 protein kinase, putative [Trichomonas vaginalis G3]KAI5523524.1 protein serine/threonine kinase protein [Trichomonas vaginalis G3]|eukprot:XP_001312952.1 protein kinase [Trichomonas vaginalis G3]
MIEKPEFTDEELYKYSYEVLYAIKACHERNIAHSDIKPANFLIDHYGRLKISDFGLSTLYENKQLCHVFKGTRMFMAPEIFSADQYNPLVADVWSIGVTLYYMATRTFPFYSNDQLSLQRMIEAGIYAEDEIHNLLFRKVVSRCLEVNVHKRATIAELLEMPYFKQYAGENIGLNNNMHKSQNLAIKPRSKDSSIYKSHLAFNRGSSRIHLTNSRSLETFVE